MDADFLQAAIVWGALGIGLACVIACLRPPRPVKRDHPIEHAEVGE